MSASSTHKRWRHVANRTFNKERNSDCSLILDALF